MSGHAWVTSWHSPGSDFSFLSGGFRPCGDPVSLAGDPGKETEGGGGLDPGSEEAAGFRQFGSRTDTAGTFVFTKGKTSDFMQAAQ